MIVIDKNGKHVGIYSDNWVKQKNGINVNPNVFRLDYSVLKLKKPNYLVNVIKDSNGYDISIKDGVFSTSVHATSKNEAHEILGALNAKRIVIKEKQNSDGKKQDIHSQKIVKTEPSAVIPIPTHAVPIKAEEPSLETFVVEQVIPKVKPMSVKGALGIEQNIHTKSPCQQEKKPVNTDKHIKEDTRQKALSVIASATAAAVAAETIHNKTTGSVILAQTEQGSNSLNEDYYFDEEDDFSEEDNFVEENSLDEEIDSVGITDYTPDKLIEKYRHKFYLDANHYMDFNGVKGAIHPHTWEISIEIMHENKGEIVKFSEIEAIIKEILNPYQMKCLNEIPPFDKIMPATENLGQYLKERIQSAISSEGWELTELAISESANRSYVL